MLVNAIAGSRMVPRIYDYSIKDQQENIRIQAEDSPTGKQRFEVMFNSDDVVLKGDKVRLALKGGHTGLYNVTEVDVSANRHIRFGMIERIDL